MVFIYLIIYLDLKFINNQCIIFLRIEVARFFTNTIYKIFLMKNTFSTRLVVGSFCKNRFKDE